MGFFERVAWSARERREGDLFLEDLLGTPPRREYGEQQAQVCGFFRPDNIRRTMAQVGAAIVARCNTEWAAWHTGTVPKAECDAIVFGRLVGYYLAANRSIFPDALTTIQRTAQGVTAYGPVMAGTPPTAAQVAAVRALLLAGAPGTTANAIIDGAIRQAREGHNNVGLARAWSAAFVSACVRGAAISEGLEAVTAPGRTHAGPDKPLLPSLTHAAYVIRARQDAAAGLLGRYHAFVPSARAPRLADIIVQDRTDDILPGSVVTLAGLAPGRLTHGDIVVEVTADSVVTIGGNVADGVRKRRFPRDPTSRLLVTSGSQLYGQENDAGGLPTSPGTSCQPLADKSTARIFALLSLVEDCRAAPAGGGRGSGSGSGSDAGTSDTSRRRTGPAREDAPDRAGGPASPPLVQSSARADFFKMPDRPGHHLAMAVCGHHWGRRPVIETLARVSEEWHRRHPGRPFGLGDISAEDGSPIGHLSHRTGVDVDVYVLRKDRFRELVRHGYSRRELMGSDGVKKPGTFRPTTWEHPFYSREWTLELIELFISTAGEAAINLIIVNDPEVVRAVRSRTRARIGTDDDLNPGRRVHDDHFHIRFNVQ